MYDHACTFDTVTGKSRRQKRFRRYPIYERSKQGSLWFIFFETIFYLFLYQGDQITSLWRTCKWRSTPKPRWPVVPGWTLTSGNVFGGDRASRHNSMSMLSGFKFWSHQLTSDPKRCLLFWKCMQIVEASAKHEHGLVSKQFSMSSRIRRTDGECGCHRRPAGLHPHHVSLAVDVPSPHLIDTLNRYSFENPSTRHLSVFKVAHSHITKPPGTNENIPCKLLHGLEQVICSVGAVNRDSATDHFTHSFHVPLCAVSKL